MINVLISGKRYNNRHIPTKCLVFFLTEMTHQNWTKSNLQEDITLHNIYYLTIAKKTKTAQYCKNHLSSELRTHTSNN